MRQPRTGRCCAERQTCTSASARIHRERGDLAAATAAPAAQPGARRAPRAAEEPAIARGSRWLGSGRPKAISAARSSCSTRRSALYVGDFSPDVRPVPAMRARVWVRQGELDEARAGLRTGACQRRRRAQLPARVRARHAGPHPAGAAFDATRRPVSWSASSRRRTRAAGRGASIEILVLQALAHQLRGDVRRRAGPLEPALATGRAGGLLPHLRRRGRTRWHAC